EMHHEIRGELLVVKILEQEAKAADLELGDLRVVPLLVEAQLGVEASRNFEIPRGHEGLEVQDLHRPPAGNRVASSNVFQASRIMVWGNDTRLRTERATRRRCFRREGRVLGPRSGPW